ncbi:SDR family NAD(P)-dependent oxidoreductase [Micromonospora sp. RTP1Z1]|uniref:SDR family NAD(P)-dependent oxidoreductase n=1 Tax=Micromonospora sp. RTP1Z1 TaxID=2994043 RepID=UPI0039B3B064
MRSQRDRLAVVTGASRGLGKALVARFAEEGWSVVACVRTPVAASMLAHDRVTAVVQDVRDPIGAVVLEAIAGSDRREPRAP